MLSCDMIESPTQIVITCNKQSTTPVVVPPPIITPPVSSVKDPGMFTSSWRYNNTLVVDQSGARGAGNVTAFPGCVNQVPNTVGCPPVSPTGVSMSQSQVLSIRYLPTKQGNDRTAFRITSGVGAGIGIPISVSLSTIPGSFNVPAACKKENIKTGGWPMILVGSKNCPLALNTINYLNIKIEAPCTTPYSCTYKVVEPPEVN